MNALFELVAAAVALLGLSYGDLGVTDPRGGWCQDFVAVAINDAGQTGGGRSPMMTMLSLAPASVQPGAVIGVANSSLIPGFVGGVIDHVAVVTAVRPNGDAEVIQGNIKPDRDHVTLGVVPAAAIWEAGITPEAHAEYSERLSQQYLEDRPWLVEWTPIAEDVTSRGREVVTVAADTATGGPVYIQTSSTMVEAGS